MEQSVCKPTKAPVVDSPADDNLKPTLNQLDQSTAQSADQAPDGVPWLEIYEAAMERHGITEEQVLDEVKRRQ